MIGWRNASRPAARRRCERGTAIMSTKRKGRAGGHQATPNTSESTCNSTGFVSRVKAACVTLAVWGLFPLGLAEWINNMRGPRDE